MTRLKAFLIVFSVWVWQYAIFSAVGIFRDVNTFSLTSADEYIPLWPYAIIFYNMYFFFIFAPFVLLKKSEDLKKVVVSLLSAMAIAWVFFIIYPVLMVRPIAGFQISNTFDSMLANLWNFDLYFPVFPSEHVLMSCLVAFILVKVYKKWALVPLLIAAAISMSTLFIKQHYIFDVVAGLVIAAFVYYFGFARKKKFKS